MVRNIEPAQLAAWLSDADREAPVLLDVREPWETAHVALPGSHLVPLGQLPRRVGELPAGRPVVVICHHGHRSLHAAAWLAHLGLSDVYNLRGGVDAWAIEVDPGMKRY